MTTRTPASLASALAALVLAALPAGPARAAGGNGFSMELLVDASPLPELYGRGNVYVEALRERPYAIRITNPLGVRVAVALAVDGRNTIDARRSTAWGASKWVLEPYESTVISGWQVDGATARQFTFTTERKSYAAWLGDASNLGVIEAVFYRERMPLPPRPVPIAPREGRSRAPESRGDAAPQGALGAPAPSLSEAAPPRERTAQKAEAEMLGDAAATGMGDAAAHPVTSVSVDLDPRPVAQVRIRYEYRRQLVSLGILPRDEAPAPRRERATGFTSFCPQPR